MEYEWHPFRTWDGRPFSPTPEPRPVKRIAPWSLLKRLPFTLVLLSLLVVGMNLLLVVSLAASLVCAHPGSRCRAKLRAITGKLTNRGDAPSLKPHDL